MKSEGYEIFEKAHLNALGKHGFGELKGWTVIYYPIDDLEGKPRVAGRFKTTKEKDDFIKDIHKEGSGWTDEELAMTMSINDYDYQLPY